MSNDTYDMRVRMLFRSRTVRIDCTKGFATLIALTKSRGDASNWYAIHSGMEGLESS